jgi:hypothetical protein
MPKKKSKRHPQQSYIDGVDSAYFMGWPWSIQTQFSVGRTQSGKTTMCMDLVNKLFKENGIMMGEYEYEVKYGNGGSWVLIGDGYVPDSVKNGLTINVATVSYIFTNGSTTSWRRRTIPIKKRVYYQWNHMPESGVVEFDWTRADEISSEWKALLDRYTEGEVVQIRVPNRRFDYLYKWMWE